MPEVWGAKGLVAAMARWKWASPAMTGTKRMTMVAAPRAKKRSAGIARVGRASTLRPIHRATMARRFATGRALAVIACLSQMDATPAKIAVGLDATTITIAPRGYVQRESAALRMEARASIRSSVPPIIAMMEPVPRVMLTVNARAKIAIYQPVSVMLQ